MGSMTRGRRSASGRAAARPGSFSQRLLTAENLERVRALNSVAERRGQSLAQMAQSADVKTLAPGA